jgi:hypothetical protein
LQEQSFGSASPELVPNLNRMAELYTIHKDFSGAEAALSRSAEIQKTAYGTESMQYAAQLRRLSSLYKEQGLESKSQSVMNQAIAIEQKTPATANSGSNNVAVQTHTDGVENLPAASGATMGSEKSTHTTADNAIETHANASSQNAENSSKTPNDFATGKTSGSERTAQSELHGQEPASKSQDVELEVPKPHESISSQPNRID